MRRSNMMFLARLVDNNDSNMACEMSEAKPAEKRSKPKQLQLATVVGARTPKKLQVAKCLGLAPWAVGEAFPNLRCWATCSPTGALVGSD